jgi:hypothetical protein
MQQPIIRYVKNYGVPAITSEDTTANSLGGSAMLQFSNLFASMEVEHINSATTGTNAKERFV